MQKYGRTLRGLLVGMVATLWAIVATSAQVAAADYFVNNVSGDDRHDGTAATAIAARSGPVRSIARALALAGRGGRIVLADTGRPYRESISLVGANHSGIEAHPFRIEGNGATLDGTQPVPRYAWELFGQEVYRFQTRRKSHQQLFFDGKPLVRRELDIASVGTTALDVHEWAFVGGYVYFKVAPGALIDEYALSCTAQPVGITLYRVEHVVISDLTIQGFQLDGVNAHDGVRHASLAGLTCRGNGRSGVAVGGTSHVSLYGCLLGDNGEAQLLSDELAGAEVVNCELLPNSAPAIVRRGGEVFVDDELLRSEE